MIKIMDLTREEYEIRFILVDYIFIIHAIPINCSEFIYFDTRRDFYLHGIYHFITGNRFTYLTKDGLLK